MGSDLEYLKCCLMDCDFEERIAAQYLQYAKENRCADALRLLDAQRKKLMDHLHVAQKRVDTVDFMIRSLKEKGKI